MFKIIKKSILFGLAFSFVVALIQLMSIPPEVRMADFDEEVEFLIIDENKTLVAEIPVGITRYNLCFGDTLQIIKEKTLLNTIRFSHTKPYQTADFDEIVNESIYCWHRLFFENGRLVAVSSKIKLLRPDADVTEYTQCELTTDNIKFCMLKKLNHEEYIFESSVLNMI